MTDLENEQKRVWLASLEGWATQWCAFDPIIEYGAASASIRRILLQVRRQISQFSQYEGPYLPSRTIYRRMCEIDDLMIRRVFSAMPKGERDTLMAEAEASVKKHGSVVEAHRARLIRERFGIPTL